MESTETQDPWYEYKMGSKGGAVGMLDSSYFDNTNQTKLFWQASEVIYQVGSLTGSMFYKIFMNFVQYHNLKSCT